MRKGGEVGRGPLGWGRTGGRTRGRRREDGGNEKMGNDGQEGT